MITLAPGLALPITILADDRESAPYGFTEIALPLMDRASGSELGSRLALDVTVVRRRLPAGDYSLPLSEDRIAVERKSLADLYETFANPPRRDRFDMELLALERLEAAAIVVEEDWRAAPAPASVHLSPAWLRSLVEGMRRVHPSIAWLAPAGPGGRRAGELLAFWFLFAFHARILCDEGDGRG